MNCWNLNMKSIVITKQVGGFGEKGICFVFNDEAGFWEK